VRNGFYPWMKNNPKQKEWVRIDGYMYKLDGWQKE